MTFARRDATKHDEVDGAGLGFVDVFTPGGVLIQRLESGPWLNAPWGVVLAPLDFGRFSHELLIGQFAGGGNTQSSGFIAAYDLATGKFDGLLQDASGTPLAINGLWSLSSGNVAPTNNDAASAPAAEVRCVESPRRVRGRAAARRGVCMTPRRRAQPVSARDARFGGSAR